MFRIRPVHTPSLMEAILLTVMIVSIMASSIIFLEATPHVPLVISLFLLIVYGLVKKVPYKQLEEGIINGAKAGIAAVLLFFLIGVLIASWMFGGTIPTLIYSGFSLVTPHYYFAVVFVVTSIIGLCVGSSLTTVGTVGLAFVGISEALDVSQAITVGAIVSGAFFGDKMSPLSDTTNMASSILDVDLFTHIRNMTWTTVPAFVIALILYGILSPNITTTDFGSIESFKQGLLNTGLVHWYHGVIPVAVLLIFSFMKAPALLALAAGSVSAIAISFINGAKPMGDLLDTLFSGYVSATGVEEIDALLTRGGMESMLFTIGLVLLALSMGGLLFTLGIIPRLLESIENLLRGVQSVILASALMALGINVLIGEQYLSILLTGESFQSQYRKVGLANKNLARVSEDAGTVVNPLVPWSVCGVFIASVLGVSTLAYLPFAFFCLLSPVLTVFFGFTGKTLTYLEEESVEG
ncbi:MAG TPA: Na+/H+ antiporter NhaC [Virgibacillus sp.]|nr:Na+/H+ antiporter NhaC [Virgibacillus sp.]